MRKVTIKIKKEVNLVLGIETKNSHQALLDTQLKITFLKVKKTDFTSQMAQKQDSELRHKENIEHYLDLVNMCRTQNLLISIPKKDKELQELKINILKNIMQR